MLRRWRSSRSSSRSLLPRSISMFLITGKRARRCARRLAHEYELATTSLPPSPLVDRDYLLPTSALGFSGRVQNERRADFLAAEVVLLADDSQCPRGV